MRLRILVALTAVLVVGTAAAVAAQGPGPAEVVFVHEVTGLGPVEVSISNPGDPAAGATLGIVEELGDTRTMVPAGTGYALAVAPPDAPGEPLAVTEPLELVAGNRYVVLASGEPGSIGFDVYLSDPIQGGNLRIVHRTGRPETLTVSLRNGLGHSQRVDLHPGQVQDLTDLPNGRYGVDVEGADGQPLAAIDHLPIVAGQWTVITIVADGLGIDLQVTGPGPVSGPVSGNVTESPSPSASPQVIRTPSRIDTGAGGTAVSTPAS